MKNTTRKNKPGGQPGNRNSVGNKGGTGAPSRYKPEYAKQAYKLCLAGFTDKDLADFFEVDEKTVNNWKLKQADFLAALKKGKAFADGQVAKKLFERATGYQHADIDIKQYEGTIIKTELVKHYPPDTTAAIFWLKNRQPGKWRDKQSIEVNYENLTDEQLDKIISRLQQPAK